MEKLNPQKHNDIITSAVQNCTKEIISLMKERDLGKIDFTKHDDYLVPIFSVFECEDDYTWQEVVSIQIENDKYLIVTGECGTNGYMDETWGDFFEVADTMPKIYEAVATIFNKVDRGEDYFHPTEYEKEYQNGVTKEMWAAIINLLGLTDIEAKYISSMKITESDDKFDYIFIDFNEQRFGANYCVIRDKKNGDIYMPAQANGAYPASIKDISMYAWVNQNHEKIMLNTNNEMEKYDEITRKRLEYLNGEGNAKVNNVFDGIRFIWHKNHTICVKSQKDISEGKDDLSYIAIYNRKNDIVPIKFYRQQLVTKF